MLLSLCRNAPQESPAAIILFPFAGGNPNDFNSSAFTSLPLDVYTVQLPGRGQRLSEPNFESMETLIPSLVEAILPVLNCPFALLGYSMGALVAFELARALQQVHGKVASALFVIADEAPQTQKAFIDPSLPDEAFANELVKLGLSSPQVLQNKEMLDVALPSVKADMRIETDYIYKPSPKLTCPIIAICGTSDPWVGEQQMGPWAINTIGDFDLHMLSGAGHLFLDDKEHMTKVRGIIALWGRKTSLCTDFSKGEEEVRQVAAVEQSFPVRRIGGLWVKWDTKTNKPLSLPQNWDPAQATGVGAYLANVKDTLILQGHGDAVARYL
eukprot:TRINITY_DN80749_c0_g1_i1.p1 TRINITY_DN80749_c0_g1~~TRINITY_DN80749_c0_g1_i1.p1  ORF type:complete len:336 (-),score=55.77 TRINITY_DN80749_c0_g1_i1:55-1035(-)